MTLTPWLPNLLLEASDAIQNPEKPHRRHNLLESLAEAAYVVGQPPTRWIILFTGTNKWEEFKGTEEAAHLAATDGGRHLKFGRTGYRLIPDNS